MQAIILFTLFGIIASVMGGFLGLSTNSIPALIEAERQQQQQAFQKIQTIVVGQLTPQFMEARGSSNTANIGKYLCDRDELRRVIRCNGTVALDVWGNAVKGFLWRNSIYPFSASGNFGVWTFTAPVTGFVLVSAGPDGKIDPRLQADLSALKSTSKLNTVLRTAAYREASATPAKDSLDDQVLTFSDEEAQSRAAADFQQSLNRIAVAAMRNYQGQFTKYSKADLPDAYVKSLNAGKVTIDDTLLNKWQTSGAATLPKFTTEDAYSFGIKNELDLIQRKAPGTSGHFVVNMSKSANILYLYLTRITPFTWSTSGSRVCSPTAPATVATNCMKIRITS